MKFVKYKLAVNDPQIKFQLGKQIYTSLHVNKYYIYINVCMYANDLILR